MLQPLPELLLPLRRQATKRRIILQRALLLVGRHIFVPAQPVPGMASLHGTIWLLIYRMVRLPVWRLHSWGRGRSCLVSLLLRRVGSWFLRKTGKWNRHGKRKKCRQKSGSVFSLPHCRSLDFALVLICS
jgi:hypothetical protein